MELMLRSWMRQWKLDTVEAARLLHCLPQNIHWILAGASQAATRNRLWPRLMLQQENMERRRCVVGRICLKIRSE